jgi:Rps23 Pro-64 3,4-dihydroxylase Tpa1-like proline 4-hydroxylase
MINNDLDIEYWRRHLHQHGRVQIPDFLQPEAAERLHQCLYSEVPWSIAVRGEQDQPVEPGSASDREAILTAGEKAREGFHFVYDRYQIIKAMKAGGDVNFPLHNLLLFMNSEQFLGFIRYFSGDRTLNLVDAQATRYRPGQFLRKHNDKKDDEGRRYAYVINLSRDWEADWGGLLSFVDDKGQVVDTLLPRWNSLSLFKVPITHCVQQVSPWALSPRFAITGWWHAHAGS